MKYLLLNASPRLEKSNTLVLTRAFIEGAGWTDVKQYDLYKLNIHFCRGCFTCWEKTPGTCIFKDDMAAILDEMVSDDLTLILSFPLYNFCMPAILKTVIERRLPLNTASMYLDADGRPKHGSRYPNRKERVICISTCGFPVSTQNYEGLAKLDTFEFVKDYTEIFCPMGELFYVHQNEDYCRARLDLARRAGEEYARTGSVSKERLLQLAQPIIPVKTYIENAAIQFGGQ
jgi:multimeric flavodoxin WrbA